MASEWRRSITGQRGAALRAGQRVPPCRASQRGAAWHNNSARLAAISRTKGPFARVRRGGCTHLQRRGLRQVNVDGPLQRKLRQQGAVRHRGQPVPVE